MLSFHLYKHLYLLTHKIFIFIPTCIFSNLMFLTYAFHQPKLYLFEIKCNIKISYI